MKKILNRKGESNAIQRRRDRSSARNCRVSISKTIRKSKGLSDSNKRNIFSLEVFT